MRRRHVDVVLDGRRALRPGSGEGADVESQPRSAKPEDDFLAAVVAVLPHLRDEDAGAAASDFSKASALARE